MQRLPAFALSLLFLVAACDDGARSPTGVPGGAEAPLFSLQSDGATGGNASFFFLPPLVSNPGAGGVADLDRLPVVVICEAPANEGACQNGSESFDADQVGEHYQFDWDPGAFGAVTGVLYRVEVRLGDVRLGFVDVQFVRSAREGRDLPGVVLVGTNRTVPIRFRIEDDAVLGALEAECQIGGEVADCDVQEGEPGEEIESTVFESQTSNRVAGFIRIPEDAVDRKFAVILKHLQKNSIEGANIPEDDQFPFFLLVNAFDEDGNPIQFQVEHPAYLALCQPADVPQGLIQFLSIFRFSDGTTEILDTNRVTPECTDNQAAVPSSRFDRVRDGMIHRVAGLFRAQPLRALHGGLHTTVSRFSEFGAVLEEELDSAPFGYGDVDFAWSSSAGSGTGPAPFFTDVEEPARGWENCSHLEDGSEPSSGTGGEFVWPVGDFDAPDQIAAASTIVLTKPFALPSNAVGVTVWAAIDNDIRVFLNGEDITGTWAATEEPSELQGIDGTGFLVNEGCAFLDQVTFTASGSVINAGGVNILEVHARDRGWIGYVNVRVDVNVLD